MIWLRLKLDLLPCIAQEVERVSIEYTELVELIRGGDKIAYRNLVLLQANQLHFDIIIQQIRTRIEEFEKFYDKNYADYRIGYFEKLKLRLRKLLSPHVDIPKEQEKRKIIILTLTMIKLFFNSQRELQQRKALSKERDSVSIAFNLQFQYKKHYHLTLIIGPFRNADESVLSKPSLAPQQKLNGSSSTIQQNNLMNLQQQAKQLYQKKTQSNQSLLQLQEPNDSQMMQIQQEEQKQSSQSYNQKNNSKVDVGKNISPGRNSQTSKIGSGKTQLGKARTGASKSPTPAQKQASNNQKTPVNNNNSQSNIKSTASSNHALKKNDSGSVTSQQKPQEQQPQPNNQAKSSVDEVVFTIRMTKEDYLKYLQQKSLKNK